MKGTITKLVSIDYDGPEEKARTYEQFHLFGSTEGAVVRNVRSSLFLTNYIRIKGIFRRKKK